MFKFQSLARIGRNDITLHISRPTSQCHRNLISPTTRVPKQRCLGCYCNFFYFLCWLPSCEKWKTIT